MKPTRLKIDGSLQAGQAYLLRTIDESQDSDVELTDIQEIDGFVIPLSENHSLYDREGVLEVNVDGQVFRLIGFSNTCTHMGCPLVHQSSQGSVVGVEFRGQEIECGPCHCHGTVFDLIRGGVVVLGPATQHLPQLRLAIEQEAGETFVKAIGYIENQRQHSDPDFENWPDRTN